MKKTEVYIKDYLRKEEYYDLLKKIKEKSFTEKSSNMEYLFSFDGNFLMRIYSDLTRKGEYGSKIDEAKIIIEKMGNDIEKDSEIEDMLLKEGFKKV